MSYSATPGEWKGWLQVPLEHAAARGSLGLFNKLLEAGADANAVGYGGKTPLIRAASRGRLSVVTTLLAADVDVDVRCNSGYSALNNAARGGHGDVVEAIGGHGADVNACGPVNAFTALHHVVDYDRQGAVATRSSLGPTSTSGVAS